MHLGLWLLFLSLARSCWCAPQQTCHPGDEFLGKVTSASTNASYAHLHETKAEMGGGDVETELKVPFFPDKDGILPTLLIN